MDGRNPLHLVLAGIFVVITLQIGEFALLWSKDTPPSEYVYLPATADKTAADLPVNIPVVVISPPDEKALRQIIRTVLEQELATYLQQTPNTSEKVTTSERLDMGIQKNSQANTQAFTEASAIVETAIAQGRWTKTDTYTILERSPDLTTEQKRELLMKITQAVNRQELIPEDVLPAF